MYPVWTWANFVAIIPVGLLAEVLCIRDQHVPQANNKPISAFKHRHVQVIGYRLTVAIGLLMREATRVVLIWGQGVPWMAAMQVFADLSIFANLPTTDDHYDNSPI